MVNGIKYIKPPIDVDDIIVPDENWDCDKNCVREENLHWAKCPNNKIHQKKCRCDGGTEFEPCCYDQDDE